MYKDFFLIPFSTEMFYDFFYLKFILKNFYDYSQKSKNKKFLEKVNFSIF